VNKYERIKATSFGLETYKKERRIIHLNWFILVGLFLFSSCKNEVKDYTKYVNTFIGTQHEGHCFPGATVPLGMVQVSPESYNDYYPGYEMDHVAGYQYNDPWIWGFTQTHLNGVGCPSMSDILLLPYCNSKIDPSERKNFRSTYDKESEEAYPGYYTVNLKDHHVNVELTATEHAAYHRYTFDSPENAKLLVDLQYGVSWDITTISENILEASQQFEDDFTLTGYRKAREWAHRDLYYVLQFNKKIAKVDTLKTPENKPEKAPRYLIEFEMEDNQLEVLVGLSTVGVDEAKKNLQAEISGWNTFDTVKTQAKEKWNKLLSLVEIEADNNNKVAFYTSLYHLYIQPNNIADIDGKYRGEDGTVKSSRIKKYYSTLSLWDTYRAANPMYTILTPSLVGEFITSMMDSYVHKPFDLSNPNEANKYLPRWQLWGKETHTMIGNHAVPVIVDAYLKGIESSIYDEEEVFEAIWSSVTKPHYRNHVELIDSFAYIPYDVQFSSIDDGRETVARLLENTYDDYCASLMANKLNKKDEFNFLNKRAAYYKNVYDTKSGFMRGKNAKGEFKTGIDPTEVVGEWVPGSDFTEGNAFHYLFHVQHDIPGLMHLMGGNDIFIEKLDSLFFTKTKPEVRTLVWNIFGTYGQYWHGNEPCHHLPYLYKYTNQPEQTDKLIKLLVEDYYHNTPDGLSGNDDCGQMSAWYMFANLGFYPVNPCGGEYLLGAPQIEEATINLPNGKKFTVKANHHSEENCIVQSVSLNGQLLNDYSINHSDIISGGKLVFEMGSETNRR
tara:strand:- start:1119 stop:3467 length:2349 start_codon:yes stop_codon:yes gene_type:complete